VKPFTENSLEPKSVSKGVRVLAVRGVSAQVAQGGLGFNKMEEVLVHLTAFGRSKGPDHLETKLPIESICPFILQAVGRRIYRNQASLPCL